MEKKGAFYEHKEFDLITFGETMLRLSPPVNELIYKSDSFKKHAGGAELNVACGVSLLGGRTGIITRLPKNQLGTFIKNRSLPAQTDCSLRPQKFLNYKNKRHRNPGRHLQQDKDVLHLRNNSRSQRSNPKTCHRHDKKIQGSRGTDCL